MKHSAVVLAGGFGSRLSPITDTRPKPLVPINGKSAYERILDLLADSGIKSAAVTTMYKAEMLEKIRHKRIETETFAESSPLGSAGAVRAIADRLEDVVLIISGDAVCEYDLRAEIAKHKINGNKCTLLLTRTKRPLDFGTVFMRGGLIERFIEKASWKDTISDLTNTGIYIINRSLFRLIPEGVFFDFSKDFFPLLTERGVPLHGVEMTGYWRDIGSVEAFYDCCMRYSGGKTILGSVCKTDIDSVIDASILFDNITVGKARIEKSIVCEDVTICDGAIISKGCVVGAGAYISENVYISSGLRVPAGVKIKKGAKIMSEMFFGMTRGSLFDDDGISGQYGSDINCEIGIKLGAAAAGIKKECKLGVLHSEGAVGSLLSESVITGARSCGAAVTILGEGFSSLASFCAKEYGLDVVVFVGVWGQYIKIELFESSGLHFSREKMRKIESLADAKLTHLDIMPLTRLESGNDPISRYRGYLVTSSGKSDDFSAIFEESNAPTDFLVSNASFFGINLSGAGHTPRFFINASGTEVSALTEKNRYVSFWHMIAIAAKSKYNNDNPDIWLPQSTPDIIERYFKSNNYTLHYYNDNESDEREKAGMTPFLYDGIHAFLLTAKYLAAKKITLDAALDELPEFYLKRMELEYDEEDKAKKIGRLASESDDCSRGVRLRRQNGTITIFPSGAGFRIFAESVSLEAADELCDIAEKKIYKE